MKNLICLTCFGMLLLVTLFSSCSDGAVGDNFVEEQYKARGTLLTAENVVTGFFDQLSPSTSRIAFDLQQQGDPVTAAEVMVSYNGSIEVPFTGVATVPSTIDVPFMEVLTAVGVAPSEVKVGDNITFTFDATTAAGKYRSSQSLTIPVSCFSDLGGTYDYVSINLVATGDGAGVCPTGEVKGQVTFTDLGGGTYLTSDLGFGQYESACWSDGPATSDAATFKDICNTLISGGQDQYGLTYTWTVMAVSGADLSISWENDFGDGGDVIISRPDGSAWPNLSTN